MKRFLLLVAVVLIVDATGLHAEDKSGTESNPITLNDSIAVTATRTPTPISEIASSITVITREEIEKSQSAFVTHLLRNVPGLDVVQSGGEGKQTALFIRGANSQHTLVLLDGVPLNDPSSPNNAVDLSNLTTANIERIEILRGPQSVLYGPEAIGGVVQLFTRTGENENNVSVNTEGGSNSRYDISAVLGGSNKTLDYSLSAERLKTDGISSYYDGTEKDGYENKTLSSRVNFMLSPTFRLDLSTRIIDAETDLDKTVPAFDDPNYYSTHNEKQYNARIFRNSHDAKWRQQLQFYYGTIHRLTYDNFDIAHPADSEFTDTQGKRIGLNFQQTYAFSKRHSFTMGAETERESFSSDLFFRSMYGDYIDNVGGKASWSRGIFLFDQIQFDERLFVTLGGRIDEHKQFGSTGTYRVTAAYHFDKSATRLRGVVGTGYKAPSVYQLYHPSVFIGNPNLKPEKSKSWGIGIDQDIIRDRLTASLTYFSNNFDDLIVGIENVDEAKSRGIESALEYRGQNFRSRLDYTYTYSKDKATDEELIRRPQHSLIWTNSFNPIEQLSLNIITKHTGKRFDQDFSQYPAARVELDSYTVVDLTASYSLNDFLELTGRVDNLFDQTYQEVFGYGNMPFSIYAGFRLSN